MSNGETKQCLGIFWDGEEVDGITVYGYYQTNFVKCPNVANRFWLESDVSVRISKLSDKNWNVCVWDIKINEWPSNDQWEEIIKGFLSQIIATGAKVAWCGLEGGFVDPPFLFDPKEMSRAVWAAMTENGTFFLHAFLSEEFQVLTDKELSSLHNFLFK